MADEWHPKTFDDDDIPSGVVVHDMRKEAQDLGRLRQQALSAGQSDPVVAVAFLLREVREPFGPADPVEKARHFLGLLGTLGFRVSYDPDPEGWLWMGEPAPRWRDA